jgi:hypothetical protein
MRLCRLAVVELGDGLGVLFEQSEGEELFGGEKGTISSFIAVSVLFIFKQI